jgi:hypothetical protein
MSRGAKMKEKNEFVIFISVKERRYRLPLPGSLALGAQHGKLDADLRT